MRPTTLALFAALAVFALTGAACSHELSAEATTADVPPTLDATPTAPPVAVTTTPMPAPSSTGPFVLAAGEAIELGSGASLHFETLTNDSRCPAGAQCVWAGEVTLSFMLDDKDGTAGFVLSSMTRRRATVKAYDIELMAYGACPSRLTVECATVTVASSH